MDTKDCLKVTYDRRSRQECIRKEPHTEKLLTSSRYTHVQAPVILVMVNGKLRELQKTI